MAYANVGFHSDLRNATVEDISPDGATKKVDLTSSRLSVREEPAELIGLEGPAEVEPLAFGALLLAQELELLRGLDAFGDDALLQASRHADDGAVGG
jgi:hypothetical protein